MASDLLSRETEMVHVDRSERFSAPTPDEPVDAKQRARSAAIVIGAFAVHLCLVFGLDRLGAPRAVVAQSQQEIPVELVTEPSRGRTRQADQKKIGKAKTAATASAKSAHMKLAGPEANAADKAEAKSPSNLPSKSEVKPQTPPAPQPPPKQAAQLPQKQPPQPEPQPKPMAEPRPQSAAEPAPKLAAPPAPKALADLPKPPAPLGAPKPVVEAKPAVAPMPAEEKKPSPESAAAKPPPQLPAAPKLPELARLPIGMDPLMDEPTNQARERPVQPVGLSPVAPRLPPIELRLPPMSETFQAVAVPSPTQDGDLITAYKTLVFSKLELAKRFPAEARKRHAHGSAIIAFTLDDQGQVMRVTLVESSGDTALDGASLALVARAAPFPPPPPGAQKEFAAVVEFNVDK